MRKCVFYLFAVAVLSGCTTTTVIKNDNYLGKSFPDRELVIFPLLFDSLTIFNWDDVVDDFEIDSANSKPFIYDTLSQSLFHHSKSYTSNINIIDCSGLIKWDEVIEDATNYFWLTKKINGEYESSFIIPKKELFHSININNSFVLIINNVIIDRNIDRHKVSWWGSPPITTENQPRDPSGISQSPGTGTFLTGGSSENLGAIVKFIIWDYKENDYVKCGMIKTKVEFPFGMTTKTWQSLFENIVKDIFIKTPFESTIKNYYHHF